MMVLLALFETAATTLMLPLMNAVVGDTNDFSQTMRFLLYLIGNDDIKQFLIKMTILIAIIYLIKGFLAYFINHRQQVFVSKIRNFFADKLFIIYLYKPYSFYLVNTTSDMQRTVITDVDWLCFFINSFMTLISEALVLLILLAVLIILNPLITIMAILFLFGSMLFISGMVSHRVRDAGEKNRIHNVEMLKWVQQTVGGLKIILVNNRRRYFENRFSDAVHEYSKYNCEYQTIFALPRIIMETVSMSGVFIMMTVLLVVNNDVSSMLPILATFAIAAVRLTPSAKRISDSYNQMKYYSLSLENIANFMKDGSRNENPKEKEVDVCDLGKSIQLKNVTFAYSDDIEHPIYRDFNLDIHMNKSTAFIGTTGSGKTTLADIILGLHRPLAGKVIVNDIDIFSQPVWWSHQIGYIPQTIYLCDDTIKNNVNFGYEDEADETKVWEALRKARLDEFVKSLPDGINTVTGENGIRLSGGQRQRIGIARALYMDPPILVLDEATSALDNETEKAIMESINYISKEKTLIVIAHRLTTIKDCDYIYNIGNGRAELKNDIL